jgi:hypothetical protein
LVDLEANLIIGAQHYYWFWFKISYLGVALELMAEDPKINEKHCQVKSHFSS